MCDFSIKVSQDGINPRVGGQYAVRPFLGGPYYGQVFDGVVIEDDGTWAGHVITDGAGAFVQVYFTDDNEKCPAHPNWPANITGALAAIPRFPAVASAPESAVAA